MKIIASRFGSRERMSNRQSVGVALLVASVMVSVLIFRAWSASALDTGFVTAISSAAGTPTCEDVDQADASDDLYVTCDRTESFVLWALANRRGGTRLGGDRCGRCDLVAPVATERSALPDRCRQCASGRDTGRFQSPSRVRDPRRDDRGEASGRASAGHTQHVASVGRGRRR